MSPVSNSLSLLRDKHLTSLVVVHYGCKGGNIFPLPSYLQWLGDLGIKLTMDEEEKAYTFINFNFTWGHHRSEDPKEW